MNKHVTDQFQDLDKVNTHTIASSSISKTTLFQKSGKSFIVVHNLQNFNVTLIKQHHPHKKVS